MKNLLAICCLIAAALFFGATQANLCEELSLRAGNGTAVDFVDLWVNECFALYSNATWGTYFATINETSRFAHFNFYGSIIGCDTVDPANFVAPATNMSDVHSGLTIPAADFVDYVELTRQALQTIVADTTVAEITEFYQIFQTFRESNTSICNQADCPSQVPIVISELANISIGYVATSATSLTVDNDSQFDVELFSVAANATDCTTEAVKLASLAPKGLVQVVDLTFAASGVYYIFQRTASECYTSTSPFDSHVLVVDYTLVEVAPVEAPLVEPVAAPVVDNTTAPVADNSTAPIAEVPLAPGNDTEPIAAPIEVPATEPVTAPVAEPVATPVEEPIAVPVDEPVSAPISAPAQDGNITPTVGEEGSFEAGGYIAGIVILVLIVIGLLIAVIVMGVKLRRNNTIVVA